jgi:hypothetical protein
MLVVAVDRDLPGRCQIVACLRHGAGERDQAVQAGDGEQPPDLVPGATVLSPGSARRVRASPVPHPPPMPCFALARCAAWGRATL